MSDFSVDLSTQPHNGYFKETEDLEHSLKLVLNVMKLVRTLGSAGCLEWVAAWLKAPDSITDDLLRLSLLYTFATDTTATIIAWML